MHCVTIDWFDASERYIFVVAVCQAIEFHCSRRSYDMCRPYFDILDSVFKSDSFELLGGQIDCAKFALKNSKYYTAVCSCLLNRICDSIVPID